MKYILLALLFSSAAVAGTDPDAQVQIDALTTENQAQNQKNLNQDTAIQLNADAIADLESRVAALEAGEPEPPVDSDGDGIPDSEDECPNDASNTCNEPPPPVDSDGDGIPDESDECPNDATNTCNDPVDPPPSGDNGLLQADVAAFDKTLDDCIAELNATGNMRCEMRVPGDHPSIDAVEAPNLTVEQAGNSGASGALTHWCGASWDPVNYRMGFRCGGHKGYLGGDHFYADLKEGLMIRSDEPYDASFWITAGTRPDGSEQICPSTDVRVKPYNGHAYDGPILDPDTGLTIMYGARFGLPQRCKSINDLEDQSKLIPHFDFRSLWACNYNDDTRANVAPGDCLKLEDTALGYPFMEPHPDGGFIYGGTFVNLKRGRITDQGFTSEAWGPHLRQEGMITYSPVTDTFWQTNVSRVYEVSRDGVLLNQWSIAEKHATPSPDGSLIGWDGKGRLTRWDNGQKAVHDMTGSDVAQCSDGGSRLYSKFLYVWDKGVYVGICGPDQGVSVFKIPADLNWQVVEQTDPQAFINEAQPGDVVTIPPGNYDGGLVLNKPVDLDLAGVNLMKIEEGKAFIVVKDTGYPSIIRNYKIHKPSNCNDTCGALRYEGVLDAQVHNFDFANQETAVLCGRGGGTLLMDTGVISDTNGGREWGKHHPIYCNDIDHFTLRNSTIKSSHYGGHLLKCSAAVCDIENNVLDGQTSRHSRIADFPRCGEHNLVNNTFIQSPNAENRNLLSLGVERCSDATLNLTGNTFTGNLHNARMVSFGGADSVVNDLGGNTYNGVEINF